MVTVWSEVAMMTDLTLDDHKAQMLWTVLRCHALVAELIALDFWGHTVMVQQMTLYMMTERVDLADGRLLSSLCQRLWKISVGYK